LNDDDIKSNSSSSSNWELTEEDSEENEETSEYESEDESEFQSELQSDHDSSDKKENSKDDTLDGDTEALSRAVFWESLSVKLYWKGKSRERGEGLVSNSNSYCYLNSFYYHNEKTNIHENWFGLLCCAV
jgi:hypothetical protein